MNRQVSFRPPYLCYGARSVSCCVNRRRRGRIEGRRDMELDGRLSSSANSSTCDSLLATPRGILFLEAPEPPLTPPAIPGDGPSLLPGRSASAEPLSAVRGRRCVSRLSKYPFGWFCLLIWGVTGADWLARRPGGVAAVLPLLTFGLSLPRPYESLFSLDWISLPAISRTRIAGSCSSSRIASKSPYPSSNPLCSSLESQMLDMMRRRFKRTAAL